MSQERRVRDAADYRALGRLTISTGTQPTSAVKTTSSTINVATGLEKPKRLAYR
jgi:hypothetical protein